MIVAILQTLPWGVFVDYENEEKRQLSRVKGALWETLRNFFTQRATECQLRKLN